MVLNTKKLEINHAEIHIEGDIISETKEISYDNDEQRAIISFPESIPESDATIALSFTGTMNDDMCGFYRSRYKASEEPAAGTPKDAEGYHYMFATQFEACDARQAFPCFDEPNLKATYDIILEVPEDLVAISNMPIKKTVKGNVLGTKSVTFETTPPMSSYVCCRNRASLLG